MKMSNILTISVIECVDKSFHLKLTVNNDHKKYLVNISSADFYPIRNNEFMQKTIAIENINSSFFRTSF